MIQINLTTNVKNIDYKKIELSINKETIENLIEIYDKDLSEFAIYLNGVIFKENLPNISDLIDQIQSNKDLDLVEFEFTFELFINKEISDCFQKTFEFPKNKFTFIKDYHVLNMIYDDISNQINKLIINLTKDND